MRSRDQRKRVVMRFAHLKTHIASSARGSGVVPGPGEEFYLAAIVQNLKTTALRLFAPGPETSGGVTCVDRVSMGITPLPARCGHS
jgi:hypothetical protein